MEISQSEAEQGPAPDTPVRVSRVDVGAGHVAIRRWGRGQPVLCLHATGHDSEDFAALADRLGGAFELVAPDWPGQGHSPADGKPPRAGHYADIIEAVCSGLGLERPILIGNSIGGAAALIAAHRQPAAYPALVLCNAGGLAAVDGPARFVIGRMVAFFEAGARGAYWYDRAFAAYYRHLVLPRSEAAARRNRIIAAGREMAPLLAEAWRGFAEPAADLRDLAPGIGIPVWLAWARSDRLVAWSRARKAAARFPLHAVTLFRGGHAAFLEDPDRFAEGFREFVSGKVALAAGKGA